MKYNVVGAGLTGATIAHLLARAGHDVVIFEKSDRIGGACYDEVRDGTLMCLYGGHILHTDNDGVWDFIKQFTTIRDYRHKVVASADGRAYQFPINLMTLMQVYETDNLNHAMTLLDRDRVLCVNPKSMEDYAVHVVGRRIYQMFIEAYTYKQWGIEASQLPVSILKRVRIRWDSNSDYFDCKHQGLPEYGYTAMIARMIGDIPVECNTTITHANSLPNVIFTGSLDHFFDYSAGILPYRSLMHIHEEHSKAQYGIATVNFTDWYTSATRIIEHGFFSGASICDKSITTKEIPEEFMLDSNERYYPIPLDANVKMQAAYKSMAIANNIENAGRLGAYSYLDMDTAIGNAMYTARRIIDIG